MSSQMARHMFWQAPRRAGQLRTTPLGLGVRSVPLAGSPFTTPMQPAYLGEEDVLPGNRLDQVSIQAIIGRIQLVPAIQAYMSDLEAYNASLRGLGAISMARPKAKGLPTFPPMTPQEAQILFEISKSPTEQERKDLELIDNLFSQNFVDDFTTTNEVCFYANPEHRASHGFGKFAPMQFVVTPEMALVDFLRPSTVTVTSRWGRRDEKPPPDTSFLDDKFWCPNSSTLGPTMFQDHFPSLGKFSSFAAMFGIDVNKTWGQVKLATQNGITMMGVKSGYPLPPPLDMAKDFVWNLAAVPHTAEIANLGVRADPESFKVWYTMAVLEKYNEAADKIIAEQKRKAKKARRAAIIKTIAFTVAGIVLAFIVPAIIAAAVAAIKAAVDAYIDAKKRAEAAKAMAETAKMFEKDAPEFAKEVQNAADIMDEAVAQEAANAPLTPEQIAAIQEVKDNPEPGQESNAGTLLVGGAAATGVVAGLIALLR